MRVAGLITVVETPEFLSSSRGLFDEDERTLLISYLVRLPVFLLTAYAKNVRADLSAKERAELKALVKEFPTTYERRKHR